MKRIIFPVFGLIALFSCKSKSSSEKEKETKDTTVNTTTPVDTSSKTAVTVSKKLTYTGYEEGDYAHLSFRDDVSKEYFDFGQPEENVLIGFSIVLMDHTTSFGYKENKKEFVKTLIVMLEKKMVNTYDGNGQPIRAEGWRIVSINQ